MGSSSTTHPFADHAFPLTAARSIWTSGTLLGKDDQGSAGQARRTVAYTDHRIGFSRYVHFYLPRRGTTPAALPTLAAQPPPAIPPARTPSSSSSCSPTRARFFRLGDT